MCNTLHLMAECEWQIRRCVAHWRYLNASICKYGIRCGWKPPEAHDLRNQGAPVDVNLKHCMHTVILLIPHFWLLADACWAVCQILLHIQRIVLHHADCFTQLLCILICTSNVVSVDALTPCERKQAAQQLPCCCQLFACMNPFGSLNSVLQLIVLSFGLNPIRVPSVAAGCFAAHVLTMVHDNGDIQPQHADMLQHEEDKTACRRCIRAHEQCPRLRAKANPRAKHNARYKQRRVKRPGSYALLE